jgi:uncharacterized protein YlxW (UPF0749 family)
MSDLAQIITAVCGFLTACLVSVRYMAGYWFKQQRELRAMDKKIYESAVDALRNEINSIKGEMIELKNQLKVSGQKYDDNREQGLRVMQALENYTVHNALRFKKVEEKVEELGKVILKPGGS